ncbi:MAG: AAA family ATPase, partial [Flavisolibacter sp.]
WVEQLVTYMHFDKREGQENADRQLVKQLKGGNKEQDYYNFLFSLDYLEPSYQLKLGDKTLSELSPGERGALLLIFYLFLDKDDIPIIIDQPEENLDNQSVYKILVHFIKMAKARRQIIIITHNPNLAVVCDAEQVIRTNIDKPNNNKFTCRSGSIENPGINAEIIDVLEGTRPALENRTSKYEICNN